MGRRKKANGPSSPGSYTVPQESSTGTEDARIKFLEERVRELEAAEKAWKKEREQLQQENELLLRRVKLAETRHHESVATCEMYAFNDLLRMKGKMEHNLGVLGLQKEQLETKYANLEGSQDVVVAYKRCEPLTSEALAEERDSAPSPGFSDALCNTPARLPEFSSQAALALSFGEENVLPPPAQNRIAIEPVEQPPKEASALALSFGNEKAVPLPPPQQSNNPLYPDEEPQNKEASTSQQPPLSSEAQQADDPMQRIIDEIKAEPGNSMKKRLASQWEKETNPRQRQKLAQTITRLHKIDPPKAASPNSQETSPAGSFTDAQPSIQKASPGLRPPTPPSLPSSLQPVPDAGVTTTIALIPSTPPDLPDRPQTAQAASLPSVTPLEPARARTPSPAEELTPRDQLGLERKHSDQESVGEDSGHSWFGSFRLRSMFGSGKRDKPKEIFLPKEEDEGIYFDETLGQYVIEGEEVDPEEEAQRQACLAGPPMMAPGSLNASPHAGLATTPKYLDVFNSS